MDFGALPPEVNSARMYAGPGSTPMMTAAAAWNGLGAELGSMASSYEAVISELTGEDWLGPASMSMAAAAEPFIAWMNTTAAALERAATQATASAAAYETAFAMTVPPPVIAANRAQLAALVATNVLGQNTPAIAATEALYGEMWAQDAIAMYGYAATSALAAVLDPLAPPASNTNPAGPAGQAAAVVQATGAQTGLSQLVAGMPGAVQGLASPVAGSAASQGFLSDVINATQNIGIWNSIQTYGGATGNIGAWLMFAGISAAAGLAQAHSGIPLIADVALAGSTTSSSGTVLASAAAPAASAGFGGAPVLAGAGQASAVGGLSVPPGWSSTTPAGAGAATLTGAGWAAPVEESASMATVPAGVPAMASASRGSFGFGTPRYGFKPTVMARPVVAG